MSIDPSSEGASSSSPKINLLERFPKMRPVKSAPALTTVNGIGLGMYGHRDEDAETGAYVKTQCFCFFFIPLFSLKAFRVVDSRESGWYFLGREPLSAFAKGWNALVACLFLTMSSGMVWNAHINSPEYLARKDLASASAKLQSGDALKAAGLFANLLTGPVSAEARPGLKAALEACLRSDSVRTNAGAYLVLSRLGSGATRPEPLVPGAVERGFERIQQIRATDADGALQLLEAVAMLDSKNQTIGPLRIELLKAAIAAHPENVDRVVQLALLYEKAEQLKEARSLLGPHQAKLGSGEGARILGQQLLQEGQFEDAYALLFPYVQARLTRLHSIERTYTNAIGAAYRSALDHLRFNRADRAFYEKYEKASKPEQEEMVEDFVQKWMQSDGQYQRALTQLKEANQIVSVTLDLGIVQLNRAQSFQDSAKRKSELEAAEKTFLAIRGVAGETDEYRMFLGQVYYWLGRAGEGQQLFDQLLASKKRAYPILMSLGRILREVGEYQQARDLLEEAYRVGKAGKERYQAAGLRAVMARETADKIAWLEKADTSDAGTQIALNGARGEQALEQGRKPAAAEFLRKAIAGYDSMTKSSGVLNNKGLAHLSLYEVTGDAADLNRGLGLLEQAVAMEPGNSILLVNTAQILVSRALMDMFRDHIRLELIKETPDMDLFGLLYNNATERGQLFTKLRANESMKKALTYLDRALLLSPKSRGLYRQQLHFQAGFEDVAELQKLQQRLHAAQIEVVDVQKEAKDGWSGAKDREYLEKFQTELQKLQTLLQSPAVQQHPATLEYVTLAQLNLKLAGAPFGLEAERSQLVEAALRLYQQHPVSATRHSLTAAYCLRAVEQLGKANATLAATARTALRTLPPRHLVAFWLEQGGEFAEAVRRNESVQKALALEQEAGRHFPAWRDSTDWALFRNVDSEETARVVQALDKNSTARLVDELEFELSPFSGRSVLEHYWSRKLKGDAAGALKTYEQALGMGMPLPPLAPGAKDDSGKLANKE